jgi:hypothetical protein
MLNLFYLYDKNRSHAFYNLKTSNQERSPLFSLSLGIYIYKYIFGYVYAYMYYVGVYIRFKRCFEEERKELTNIFLQAEISRGKYAFLPGQI